jgi:raffinose/stachyose/melibiose transport system permease protein
LYGIFISFTKWDGIADNYTIIGLANYEKVFNTSKFWLSLQRTGIYTVGTVVLSNVVALILGLLLTSSLKGRNAFRTAIYVPNVVGGVAMGYIWQYIFNYGFTKIGQQLGSAYFSTSMLSDPNKAMIALVVVSSWQLSAYLMIIYVAGFTNVPTELVEAARVDGANAWRVFWHVRMPMIRPSVTICLFLAIVRSFMVFEINLSLTDGGPFNSTEMIALRIYNTAYVSLKFGNAQAQAVILFVIVAFISVLQAYFTQKREVQM